MGTLRRALDDTSWSLPLADPRGFLLLFTRSPRENIKMADTVKLTSSDGQCFDVEKEVAFESDMIKNMLEDCEDASCPLPNVTSKILTKVIEYCKYHVAAKKVT